MVVFILSYQRPQNQKTLNTLLSAGYTGDWYIVLDDTDKTYDEYLELYGKEHLLVFNKQKYIDDACVCTYPKDSCAALYARNAIEDFAKSFNLDSFIMLDDDIEGFTLRWEVDGKLKGRGISKNITEIFENILNYICESNIACASAGYQIIYFGGSESISKGGDTLRLPVEAFFRNAKHEVKWINHIFDDYTTGIYYGQKGQVWLMLPFIQVNMPPAMKMTEQGGHTNLYSKYTPLTMKIFSKVMTPTSYVVRLSGGKWYTTIRKNHVVPKIVKEN